MWGRAHRDFAMPVGTDVVDGSEGCAVELAVHVCHLHKEPLTPACRGLSESRREGEKERGREGEKERRREGESTLVHIFPVCVCAAGERGAV